MGVHIERTPYRIEEAEEAYEFISRGYARLRPEVSERVGCVAHAGVLTSTGTLTVDRVSHGVAGAGTTDPYSNLTVMHLRSGRFDLDFGRFGTDQVGAGGSWLYMQDGPGAMRWEPVEAEVVSLPWDVVAARAAALTGIRADALRFESISPVTPQAARAWRSTSAMVLAALTSPDSGAANELIHHALIDVVVASALAVFPNTTMTRDEAAVPNDPHPAAVRRAMAYADEHAHLPLTVQDLARASRLSVRGVQLAFQRSLGMTPMQYVARVRLDGVHRDLLAGRGEEEASVTTIAQRWGFGHMGRFAARYREAFGELPSETLGR